MTILDHIPLPPPGLVGCFYCGQPLQGQRAGVSRRYMRCSTASRIVIDSPICG